MAAEAGVDLRTLDRHRRRRQDHQGRCRAGGGQSEREQGERAKRRAERARCLQLPVSPALPLPVAEVAERIPLKGVRGIIADRMGTSVHTTARVTLMMEVDATEFVAVRERLKAKVSEEWGFAPGYNDLLAKIVAQALRKFPYMNARLAPDAIELLAHVNMGMAVDTERGLLVPVIRDADQKILRQFGPEFREMVDRARKGRSLPDDLSGGTFTITNLGMYDVDALHPGHQPARGRHPGRGAHRAQVGLPRRIAGQARPAPDVDAQPGVRPPPGRRRAGRAVPAVHQAGDRGAVSAAGGVRADERRRTDDQAVFKH